MQKNLVLKKENVEDILSLTPTQEGMLFHQLMDAGSDQYKVSLRLVLTGKINFSLMKTALNEVFKNNEVLRSVYKWENLSKPVQIILKEKELPVCEYDFRFCSEEEKKLRIDDVQKKDIDSHVDISCNPIQISLCHLDENKCVMIVTNHHILFDGWSNGIIYKEFLETYDNLIKGTQPFARKKTRYKDFIKYTLSLDLEKQSSFWNHYLNGLDEKTVLPYTNLESPTISIERKSFDCYLNEKVTQELNDFVRKNNLTLASVIYCAWGIALKSYSNSTDILFGTTVSGRPSQIKNIESIVGMFINTIPLRVSFDEKDSVLSLLKKIAEELVLRKEYENTPLPQIMNESDFEKQNGLFDSIVVLENYPFDNINFEDQSLKVESYEIKESNNYNLTLTVMFGDVLKFNFSYNDELFDFTLIKNLSENFIEIVKIIINSSDKKLCDLEFLSASEKEKLENSFNDTSYPYDDRKTIISLFEEQVKKAPDKIAVVCDGEKISYKDLNLRANSLAKYLKNRGVKKGNVIGIILDRSIDLFVAMIGAVKTGAAYLPIDPEYPQERIDFILKHSNCSKFIAGKNSRFQGDQVVHIDDSKNFDGSAFTLKTENNEDDLLYIIYTSGSTGDPKGVMISHKSVHNFVNGMCRRIDFNEEKTIVSVTTISFDIFVLESWLPLLKGLKIVLAKKSEQNDPELLNELIIKNKVNIIQTTPSRFSMLLESGKVEGLKNLSEILVGGEPFPEKLLFELNKTCTGRIFNVYGPTETTVWSAVEELTDKKNVSIGKAIDNTKFYVLDSNLKLVPIGATGELFIGGDGLALGYFKNPRLTEEKFIQSPFESNKKIYRTGDLVKWLPNGTLKFVGRNDTQVKIRGYRVELSEIESQVLNVPEITAAVVLSKKKSSGENSIYAFVTSNIKYSQKEFSKILSKKLPTYMIPSYFIIVDKFPVLQNGKVDRKALLNFNTNFSVENNGSYIPPENELQRKIIDVWAEVLNLSKDKIGISDRFFDIGGNSLTLVRVHLKIDKLFPHVCKVADLFTYNTIESMAEFIGAKLNKDKQLNYGYIEFPWEYFCDYAYFSSEDVIRFEFDEVTLKFLKQFAGDRLSYFSLVQSMYMLLISRVTGVKEVFIQVASGQFGFNKVKQINLNFDNISCIEDAITFIKNSLASTKPYSLSEITINKKLNEYKILPLVYEQESFDFKNEYVKFFDMAIGVSLDDMGKFVFKYNSGRLKKDKAKEFIKKFMSLMKSLANYQLKN